MRGPMLLSLVTRPRKLELTLVLLPPEPKVDCGLLKFTLLKVLNVSRRSSKRICSLTGISFIRARLVKFKPSPWKEFLPVLPNVPGSAWQKADGSKKKFPDRRVPAQFATPVPALASCDTRGSILTSGPT